MNTFVFSIEEYQMVRKIVFLSVALALLSLPSASQAQGSTPTPLPTPASDRHSVLLYEQNGEINLWDIWEGQAMTFTADIEEFASSPRWGGSGAYVTFEVDHGTDNESNQVPMIGDVATGEVTTIPRCEMYDVECRSPQMNSTGEWVVMYGLRRNDGHGSLYAYNMADKSMTLLLSGDYDMSGRANGWLDETHFVVSGPFDGSSRVTYRLYDVATGEYRLYDNTSAVSIAVIGCNSEIAEELFQDGTINVTIDYLGQPLVLIPEAFLGEGNPWRNCTAEALIPGQ